MISIPNEVKDLYKNDLFPLASTINHKQITLYFPELDLTITNDRIREESFELDEGLCRGDNLIFGTCESSQLKVSIANIDKNIVGKKMIVSQRINDIEDIPLGHFYVESCNRKDDSWFREVIAYDDFHRMNVNVADWYDSMFPTGEETYALANFRASLLSHFDIEEEPVTLPNDELLISKTITVEELSGIAVLESCVQLNGAFGHMNRQGKFTRIVLEPSTGLYPVERLYPYVEVLPVSPTDSDYIDGSVNVDSVSKAHYKSVYFEDYTVKGIDKLIIKSDTHDVGFIYGEGNNAYVMSDNFLLFGKSSEELENIAANIYGNIAQRPYCSFHSDCIGLPYLEIGDAVEFVSGTNLTTYIMQRTMTGIQKLRDNYKATGTEYQPEDYSMRREIIALKGKTTKIEKSVEGVRIEIADLETDLTTDILALAGQIVLKVDSDGNVGLIQLDADPDTDLTAIKIKADNISLEGLVTINNNFKVLEDGTIEAVNAKFSGIIESSRVVGSEIEVFGSSAYFKSSSWDGETYGTYQNELVVQNGVLRCAKTLYLADGQTITWGAELTPTDFTVENIDSATVITNTLGSTARPALVFVSKLQTGDGKIQLEGGNNPYLYVDGPTAGITLNDGDVSCYAIYCNNINGGTPITTANMSNYSYPPTSHSHVISIYDVDNLYSTLQEFDGRLRALGG